MRALDLARREIQSFSDGVCVGAVMAREMNCPMCATIKAFNEALLKWMGAHQSYDPRSCSSCGGSGKVPEPPRSYEKPRKELTGPEWMEREYQDEWNHYVTFERPIE